MNNPMNDYDEYCDEQVQNQELFNECVEMSQNTEQNPNPHMRLDPPNNPNRHSHFNLSEQNPQVKPSSLINYSEKKENKAQNEVSNQTIISQSNIGSGENVLDPIDFLMPNYDDDRLDFYAEISNVEVNQSQAAYRLTENQASELAENSMQQTQINNCYKNTTDSTKQKNC